MNTTCINQNQSVQVIGEKSIISRVFSNLINLSDNISQHLELRKQRRIDRDSFNHLLNLDASILDDIGVTRADVIWASKLPITENASKKLEKVARQNCQ